ncbi:MAG TPA: FtsQ-type POTRA domain-containing protein [Candidatus Limnocylindrales bacterium]|nr:FtsQ-type POTRA domain-containing protein [Candidatus Limnocylindrales bacterium]
MARELIEVNPREPRTSATSREENFARTITPTRASRAREEELNTIDLEQEEEAQFLRTQKRVPVRRSAIPKKTARQVKLAALIVGAAMTVCGAAATAYGYGVHSWRFRINSSDNVEISGVHNASRTHVMEVAGADIGRNIFFVPLEERKRQLEQIPWVESATVMRLLPNRIAVSIRERTPVAFVQIGSRISLVDSNGVIMGMPANRQTNYSFPVIHGISDTEPLSSRAAAMKIYNRMAQELDSAGEGGPRYTRQLSEVDLSDPEDVKVTANEGGGTLLVHLGAQDFLQRYKLYVDHIGEWRQQFPNLQSVDLRYDGQIVVNPDGQGAPPPAAEAQRHGDQQGKATRKKPVQRAASHPAKARPKMEARRKRWRKK